jgi:glycosyltransferase involved in cell wall biosynthesis
MEDILFNLVVGLPAVGVQVTVASLAPGPLVDRLSAERIDLVVLGAGQLRDPSRFLRTSRRLGRLLRTSRFDAVYSNMPKAHLYVAPAARALGVPTLWCQAGHPEPAHWIDRLATALPATSVVALSRDSAAAQQRLSARRTVRMLHPGIDVSRFRVRDDPDLRSRHGIPEDGVVVSLVGRLQPWKGQREFLRAAARLADSHPEAWFAVVGGAILGWEGDYPQELQRLAAALGIGERVIFTGHSDEVSSWMAASDIMVNASQPEPFGLVVIEAMASGVAVVAVATGGPRDIIEHERNGLLCGTREPEALAAAIGRLLDDPVLRAELGRAARARVETYFSRAAMTERFASIVKETISAQMTRSVDRGRSGRLDEVSSVTDLP